MDKALWVAIVLRDSAECEQCSKAMRKGARAYATDAGDCCSQKCARLRVEDSNELLRDAAQD